MIPVKANDVRDLTFRLLQQADADDLAEVIVETKQGVRYKAWDLTGCVVAAHVRRNGDANATVISPTISDAETGVCVVRIGTSITAVTFAAGERHRDASIEFEVTKTDGQIITTPDDGYSHIRIFRDLDEG